MDVAKCYTLDLLLVDLVFKHSRRSYRFEAQMCWEYARFVCIVDRLDAKET